MEERIQYSVEESILINYGTLIFPILKDLLSSLSVRLLLNVSKIGIEISKEFEILILIDSELMSMDVPFLHEVIYRLDDQHEQLQELREWLNEGKFR